MIGVIIIAPALAVRAGLRAILSDDPHIQVISEGAGLADLEKPQLDADVVIWSPSPAMELEMVKSELMKIRLEGSAALLLIHDDPNVMEQLSRLPVRAWGVLGSESSQAELVTSIQALNEGLVVINPIWLKHVLTNHTSRQDNNHDLVEPLTEREIEILQLLAYGLTNKQIAARLRISAHTVKFHVSTIFNKLGTTNRVETVNLGLKKGLIVL